MNTDGKLRIQYVLTPEILESGRQAARLGFIRRWSAFLIANAIILIGFFAVLGMSGFLQALSYEALLLLGLRIYRKELVAENDAMNRTYIRNRKIDVTIEFSTEGIEIVTNTKYFCDWLLFSGYKETNDFLILYSKGSTFIFPKSALASEGDSRFITDLIQKRLKI
jgi:hypothetical protein